MTTQPIETTHSQAYVPPVLAGDEMPVRWSIPLALFACVVLAFFDKISIAALFSDTEFQNALGLSFDPTLLGLLMTAFLLSYGISSMFLSSIGDYIEPKKLLIWMMCVWCMLMVCMGFANSYRTMMMLRIMLGIAEGPLFSLAFAIVRHSFPQRLQARATMLWLLGTPIGAALGFPVTLFILHHFGWRWTFFAMATLTIPVIFIVIYGLRHVNVTPKLKAAQLAKSTPENPVLSRKQERQELYKSWQFWLICIFNIAFLTYLWGINGWLPSYLIKGKGIHLEQVGYLSSLPFIAMLLGEGIGAYVSDRLDRRAMSCFISLLGASAGLVLVLYIEGTYQVIAAMAFSTFMWGIGAPNVFALLAKVTSARVSATAGGIFNGLGNFAGALAPVVMGMLIAASGNMDVGLLFLVIVAVTGCVVLLPLVKRY